MGMNSIVRIKQRTQTNDVKNVSLFHLASNIGKFYWLVDLFLVDNFWPDFFRFFFGLFMKLIFVRNHLELLCIVHQYEHNSYNGCDKLELILLFRERERVH